ncbi:MAG TPA: RNase adapter RapZ, partial [Betaproteobacteria bacterium]|nr:RNase adapter RapZ [Betaproteobacteria bacterium]
MQLILISGLSGSGKSIALNVLEDCGYYCIDNLPLKLLPDTLNHLKSSGHDRLAISMDARGGESLRALPAQVVSFREQGIDTRIVFLEAKTGTLVNRFSETRRRHPLSKEQRSLPEAIRLERDMLEPVIAYAHRIDTSDLGPNNLRAWIKDFINVDQSRLTLQFQSFGFKHGIPLDADMVFDVRCLPNPHYDPKLRPLT